MFLPSVRLEMIGGRGCLAVAFSKAGHLQRMRSFPALLNSMTSKGSSREKRWQRWSAWARTQNLAVSAQVGSRLHGACFLDLIRVAVLFLQCVCFSVHVAQKVVVLWCGAWRCVSAPPHCRMPHAFGPGAAIIHFEWGQPP